MASRRKSRFDMPHDRAVMVRAMRICRDAMTDASGHLTIGGPVYRAARVVTQAIDAMAFLLTGDREYFWEKGGGSPEGHRQEMAERAARERGKAPWE